MRLLTVDTSGPVCGVAVTEGERVLSEFTSQNRNTHSASLMPMIERCLESAGLTLEEMDALAVVTGPGSFTGVRIGVATVKALAHGSGKPCIGVDALEALAASAGAAAIASNMRARVRLSNRLIPLEHFIGIPLPLTRRFPSTHRELYLNIL